MRSGEGHGSLVVHPIGVARTPFFDRVSAPRQPYASQGAGGIIQLDPSHGYEHALSDLEGWDYLWVLFWFHLNEGWRPKVLPPRSARKRRGVFSTRSPHRPNPIGLSVVRLERIDGLCLHVRDVDMIDGTPVLDIKPYVPYADAIPHARTGWMAPLDDPDPGFAVFWDEPARTQARWLLEAHAVDLALPITRTLSIGPQPHPYRRIRRDGVAFRLAVRDWRVRFRVEGRAVTVESIASGYRPAQLSGAKPPGKALPADADHASLEPHRAFVARFGS